MKLLRSVVLLFVISLILVSNQVSAETISLADNSSKITDKEFLKIDKVIEKYMEKGKIPGLSVVVVQGDREIFTESYGYADVNSKRSVTLDTLFELGSNSKAFTGMAILKLAEEGSIDLNAPVQKYLPWLEMKYSGEYGSQYVDDYVDVTISQFLYHTSGIPFKTIGQIPESSREDALEQTVKTLINQELDFYPGTKFQYATLNYDVLGQVISEVTKMSYEEYIMKQIIEPLGLHHTQVDPRNQEELDNLATGYKYNYFQAREYDAPEYRGNLPAGYILTNAIDLAKWMKLQLGIKSENVSESYKKLFELSHLPDRSVAPMPDGSSYAAGWTIVQSGDGEWRHSGENPNFSSYITLRPGEQLGVGVLANISSSFTYAIGQDVMNILAGRKQIKNVSDSAQYYDKVAVLALIVSITMILSIVSLLVVCAHQIVKKQRRRVKTIKRICFESFYILIFLSGLGYCLYELPNLMFFDLPWSFVKVWAPSSIMPAVIAVFIAIFGFCLLFMMTGIYPKENEKSLFLVSVLSIVSGLGNALLIIIINETFARDIEKFQYALMLFFLMGLILYVVGQRLVRVRLLKITNQIVYEKRITLIKEIQEAPYEKIQRLEDGKIHAGLNNDTETMSVVANLIVTAFTSVVTLIVCFIYIGLINFYGFLLSFGIIVLAALCYFMVGKYANHIYEHTRDIQNAFFRYINDLIGGFKVLKINQKKQDEFGSDMVKKCEEYRDQKVKAALAFANVFVAGELLFTVVIGIVVFVFPVVFKDMESLQLRNYIFIFLYMTGPVNSVLSIIPELIRTNVSYKRINSLIQELSNHEKTSAEVVKSESSIHLKLENVSYSYANESGNQFKVGPIKCEFRSGEVTFITGGNGSGKTTLGHILTGLYHPISGNVYLNDIKITPEQLSQNYSAVFNDYYLFTKLYGIQYEEKANEIEKYLKILRIEDKVSINDGFFSTTQLSTGQRKRLALLLTYLEDRDIYFFDEWAADQEPVFREFFYNDLLQDLREKGKCIIVITHDDRYFDKADKIMEMELGQIKRAS
ncbi:cyclic peptide export ABC transporter [Paenibacillus sp. LMG 31461]|uniref:Cyclic peptide export ABC transporter n=1 Tax=Paenibacillus plantarum TaxID=2654975 RepID=A0ABX1X4U4_9BACL|nr:cyclic peptide export ABC transporter [Paenibacillus plantarum]NOU63261.1 cyclic peptide export ABC transporter [Paenibacillus plantarum]